MSIQLPVIPYSSSIKPGEVFTGKVVSEKLWVESNPGAKGPQDKGKANLGWRWRVRIFNGGFYNDTPDDQLPLFAAKLRDTSSTPLYRENDIVTLEHVSGGTFFITGLLPITGAGSSTTPPPPNRSLQEQSTDPNDKNGDLTCAATILDRDTVLKIRNEQESITSITGACSDKTEYDGMSTALKNFIATVNTIKSYTTTYLSAATKIVGDLDAELKRTASIMGGFIQMLFQRIRAYVITKIENGIRDLKDKLHPPDKRQVAAAANKALDTICCIFDKILDRALPIIEDFLKDVVNRFVNAPMCAIESAIGSLTADVTQDVGQGIDAALGPVKSALGSIGQVVGQIFEVADFVTSVLGFFTCDSGKPLCPGVKEWGWFDGPNPKDVANFSNVVTNFNLSGGTQQLLGSATSAGLGTAPGTLGYALGFGTGPAPTAPPCNIGPVDCGPPNVSFFGGGGSGSTGNAIISATGSILGIDITSKGSAYSAPPFISFDDPCGNGKGASAQAQLDAGGFLSGIFMSSSGAKYLSAKDGSIGGNKSTKVPKTHSGVSVPPTAAPTTPTTPVVTSSTKSLSGFTLEVTPSSIIEGETFSIKLIPPSSVNVGDVFTAKITTDTPSPDSVLAKLSSTYIFNKKLPPVVDKTGVKEIAEVTISTISDTIKEKNEKVTIEIVEVPGLSTTIEVNDNTSSPYSSTSTTISDFNYEVQPSITVKEGETAQVVVRRTGKDINVETKISYEIFNDAFKWGPKDPKVAEEGTHFLYPKDSAGARTAKGTITFAKMQKDFILDIITLSAVGLSTPGIDSRQVYVKISKNGASFALGRESFSTDECLIVINERKAPEKDAGTAFYQAPLLTRINELKETGLYDPAVKQVVKFKDAGTIPGEIYVGSLPEVKLFQTELNAVVKSLPTPLTYAQVENLERLEALALDSVLRLYISSLAARPIAAPVVREIKFVVDINDFLDTFKDTGSATPRNENTTKDGRKGPILEDKYTYSGYKSTKENIPLYWELNNIDNDDIESYTIIIRSDEVKYAGSSTIYWNLKNIDPIYTSTDFSTKTGRNIDKTKGNKIPRGISIAPGYTKGTVIDSVRPNPPAYVPFREIGYVAPELPSRIPGFTNKTAKYTIIIAAYIKDYLGGGLISDSLDFFVEG